MREIRVTNNRDIVAYGSERDRRSKHSRYCSVYPLGSRPEQTITMYTLNRKQRPLRERRETDRGDVSRAKVDGLTGRGKERTKTRHEQTDGAMLDRCPSQP